MFGRLREAADRRGAELDLQLLSNVPDMIVDVAWDWSLDDSFWSELQTFLDLDEETRAMVESRFSWANTCELARGYVRLWSSSDGRLRLRAALGPDDPVAIGKIEARKLAQALASRHASSSVAADAGTVEARRDQEFIYLLTRLPYVELSPEGARKLGQLLDERAHAIATLETPDIDSQIDRLRGVASAPTLDDVRELVRKESVIEAIRLYRQITGADLLSARRAVDAMK